MQCISAIDNCLWNIKAQAANLPLCQLLGGRRRERVLAYASTLFRETPEGNAQAARDYIAQGFRAVKFGWGIFGEDAGRDVEILAAIKEVLGPDRHLMVDPGWYGQDWSVEKPGRDPFELRTRNDNIALCERVAPFEPTWVEDFVHPENFEEYSFLQSLGIVPIAAGEQVATTWDFKRFIEGSCVDIIQPDLTRCGGLTVAKRVAELANQCNIQLVPHSWLSDLLHAYSLHLIATLPRALFLEFNIAQSALTKGICGGVLELNDDGTVSIPEAPGLGVEVDEEFIQAHRVN
jgi:L-alanine-DL-glutamate epimerase-like enolase superfamily enzyme